MLINEMHDDHLRNAIAMIYRGHDAKGRAVTHRTRMYLPALLVEQEVRNIRRGERDYNNPLWG
jgi:hypothetical protein